MAKQLRDTWQRSRYWLSAIFATIVLSFIAATAFVHWRSQAIDRAARDIADNAAPSIEHLTAARIEAHRLPILLREELERGQTRQTFEETEIQESRDALNRSVDAYLAIPALPEEREVWNGIFHGRAALDDAVERFEWQIARGDIPTAAFIAREQVPAVAAGLNEALTTSVQTNASHAAGFAREIQHFWGQGTRLAVVLDVLCTVIAIGGVLAIRRLLRSHADLVERHRVLHEERASELEAFAGRVSHDILSPLGTVVFALELARKQGDEEQRQRLVGRGLAAVERIKKIVHGLLEFARAGGKPEAGARADLDAVVTDVLAELKPIAAEAGAELRADPDGKPIVACHPGVLTSLLANLARNAIKYLGDGPVRRVTIKARQRAGLVRVEVADTGPGLPPEIEDHVFEPYVRAPNAKKPGFGLGLATVKRLADAHGGRVGVESRPGEGCTFWFELPTAEPAAEPTASFADDELLTERSRAHVACSEGSRPWSTKTPAQRSFVRTSP